MCVLPSRNDGFGLWSKQGSYRQYKAVFQDFPGLAKTKFQDSQNSFLRTFHDKFGSQTWLHKVQKVHIKSVISVTALQ